MEVAAAALVAQDKLLKERLRALDAEKEDIAEQMQRLFAAWLALGPETSTRQPASTMNKCG